MEKNLAFGIAFRRLRQLKGMVQEDFATVVSERYIRMLEKGEYSPSLSTLQELAKLLGIGSVSLMAVIEAETQDTDAASVARQALAEVMELLEAHDPL